MLFYQYLLEQTGLLGLVSTAANRRLDKDELQRLYTRFVDLVFRGAVDQRLVKYVFENIWELEHTSLSQIKHKTFEFVSGVLKRVFDTDAGVGHYLQSFLSLYRKTKVPRHAILTVYGIKKFDTDLFHMTQIKVPYYTYLFLSSVVIGLVQVVLDETGTLSQILRSVFERAGYTYYGRQTVGRDFDNVLNVERQVQVWLDTLIKEKVSELRINKQVVLQDYVDVSVVPPNRAISPLYLPITAYYLIQSLVSLHSATQETLYSVDSRFRVQLFAFADKSIDSRRGLLDKILNDVELMEVDKAYKESLLHKDKLFLAVVYDATDDKYVAVLIAELRDGDLGGQYRTLYIHEIHVHPKYRGRGLGKRLIETVLVLVRTRDKRIGQVDAITLDVDPNNVLAVEWYKRLGFIGLFYTIDGYLFMVLWFRPLSELVELLLKATLTEQIKRLIDRYEANILDLPKSVYTSERNMQYTKVIVYGLSRGTIIPDTINIVSENIGSSIPDLLVHKKHLVEFLSQKSTSEPKPSITSIILVGRAKIQNTPDTYLLFAIRGADVIYVYNAKTRAIVDTLTILV